MNSIYHSIESRRHPLVMGTYSHYTHPIKEFIQTLSEWIDEGIPGGYIYGLFRRGKSVAVRDWSKNLLAMRCDGQLPLFTMSYESHDRFSEHDFLSELLAASKHPLVEGRSRREKLQRLVNLYATTARNAGNNRIVLIVDEAQRMHSAEYDVLCNLQNALEEHRCKLTVISVGSHEIAYQHDAFLRGGGLYLAARFFVRDAPFRGIRSEDELQDVLNGYDVNSEWPESSGTSYTCYFFPKAFAAGFRISALKHELWEVFEELAPEGTGNRLELPMEHIAKTVEGLIRSFGDDDGKIPQIRHEDLVEAVKKTKFHTFMKGASYVSQQKRSA
jgi:hypothetical protein